MTDDATPAATPDETLTVVVLTEEALGADDAARITALHDDQSPEYRVLVPADTERNLLADVVDHLSMLEWREALETLRGEPEPVEARTEASEALAASLAALQGAGYAATGEVTDDDPLPALRRAVAAAAPCEVVVVTRPHALEDTFHRDWASRARDELGVPVLHVYAGTTFLG